MMADRFHGRIALGGKVTKEQFAQCNKLADDFLCFEGKIEDDGSANFHECTSDAFIEFAEYCKTNNIALTIKWDSSWAFNAYAEFWIDGNYKQFDIDSQERILIKLVDLEEQRASMTINEFIESLGIPEFPEFSIVEPTIVYNNKNHNVKLPVVEGKYYVVDVYSGPIAGPFDTYIQASTALNGMAIEDDCEIGECEAINAENLKFMICGIRFRASR